MAMPIFAPAGRGEPERRMELRRQTEADADFLDATQHTLWRQFDGHAQLLEHVGRAALRRRGPGTVLAHRHAGTGDDDGGHRADVDRMAAISAGTDDVDRPRTKIVAERDDRGSIENRVEQATELFG